MSTRRKNKVKAVVRTRRKATRLVRALTKKTSTGRRHRHLERRAAKAVELRVSVLRKNPSASRRRATSAKRRATKMAKIRAILDKDYDKWAAQGAMIGGSWVNTKRRKGVGYGNKTLFAKMAKSATMRVRARSRARTIKETGLIDRRTGKKRNPSGFYKLNIPGQQPFKISFLTEPHKKTGGKLITWTRFGSDMSTTLKLAKQRALDDYPYAGEFRIEPAVKQNPGENPRAASRSELLLAAHESAVRGAVRDAKTFLAKAAKIRSLTMAEIARVWKHCLPEHLRRNPRALSTKAKASLGKLVRRIKGRVTKRNVSGSGSGQRLCAVRKNPRRKSRRK